MKKGGGSESTIIVGPSMSVLVFALHSLEYVLGFARFRVFEPKLYYYYYIHVDFTNMPTDYKKVYIDNIKVPHSNSAKYLGMTLDAKLRWQEHVKKKKQEFNLIYSKMYWLIGRNSKLSTYNKL